MLDVSAFSVKYKQDVNKPLYSYNLCNLIDDRQDAEYYKNLPVIALTGNTVKEQQEEYMQAGMNDYLSKTLDMEDICRKIRKWIPDKIE